VFAPVVPPIVADSIAASHAFGEKAGGEEA